MTAPLAVLPRLDGIYHYIRLSLMDDALKLGWLPTRALEGTHHGYHAVLCLWICRCKMVVPG